MDPGLSGLIIVALVCAATIFLYRTIARQGPLPSRVPCPACKELVIIGALVCPHCRLRFTEGEPRLYMHRAVDSLRDAQAAQQIRKRVVTMGAVIFLVFATAFIIYKASGR